MEIIFFKKPEPGAGYEICLEPEPEYLKRTISGIQGCGAAPLWRLRLWLRLRLRPKNRSVGKKTFGLHSFAYYLISDHGFFVYAIEYRYRYLLLHTMTIVSCGRCRDVLDIGLFGYPVIFNFLYLSWSGWIGYPARYRICFAGYLIYVWLT